MSDGQERSQPERDADRSRFQILPQAVALETQVPDTDAHECKRCVEDRNRERGSETVGVEGRREQQHRRIDPPQPDDQREGDIVGFARCGARADLRHGPLCHSGGRIADLPSFIKSPYRRRRWHPGVSVGVGKAG